LSRLGMVAAGLGIALMGSSVIWAGAKDDAALAKAPAKVQAAAKKALGEKKLEEFGKESVGGKIFYEVGFKVGSVDHAYIISESGELVQEEADVDAAKLPAPVAATVKKAHPDGKIDEAAIATAGDKKFYAVDVKVGKDIHAMDISMDGKLIADEIEIALNDDAKANDKK